MQTLTTIEMDLPEPASDDNAERARHWHNIAHQCGRGMLEAAFRAGEALIEQRDLCQTTRGGSTFGKWVDENTPFDRSMASRYMRIAEHWELLCAHNSSEHPLSIREANKLIAESRRGDVEAKRLESQPAIELPEGTRVIAGLDELADGERFSLVYADPPWQYENQGTRAATDNHYPTMPVADICSMPVKDYVADNAQLHLWTTSGFIREAFEVIDAWGFQYRSMFIWAKPTIGIGNYWRVSHEILLCAIRGSATFRNKSLKSWAELECGRHSQKPEAVRGMITKAFPGPYLELFGRRAVEGWTVLGNEVDRTLLDS